ncbi:MAG TPA: YceI family protein [Bdellovibrionota bacterium]|nr:YceI family protein [Bdellovibrionota bacterium]
MKHMIRIAVLTSLALGSTLALAAPAHYTIDPAHSSVEFSIKHMMISKVKGKFTKFGGEFTYDEAAPQTSSAKVDIETASINTDEPKRDTHLKSPDFFNAEKNPHITFVSTGVKPMGKDHFQMMGNLTMNGVTHPVTLDVTAGGMGNDPWGNARAAFSATGKVNRKDYKMLWNKGLDKGGVLVGDDVDMMIEVEGIKK